MRNVPIMILVAGVMMSDAASAEYNPATGQDDIVLIPETKEVQMGNSIAKDAEKQFGLAKDDKMQERVSEIGQRIAAVCDRPNLAYSFRVLEGAKLEKEQRYNAFSLPGGYVYIFKDMVEDMESDDELAAILAHEVGHVVAKHSIKKLQESIGLAGLGIIGAVAGSDRQSQARSSAAIAQLMMANSRQAEYEADKLEVKYLKAAGFDPRAAVAVIDKMLERRMKGKVYPYRYLRTHPYTSERRAMLNKEIEGSLSFQDYINTSGEAEGAFK